MYECKGGISVLIMCVCVYQSSISTSIAIPSIVFSATTIRVVKSPLDGHPLKPSTSESSLRKVTFGVLECCCGKS